MGLSVLFCWEVFSAPHRKRGSQHPNKQPMGLGTVGPGPEAGADGRAPTCQVGIAAASSGGHRGGKRVSLRCSCKTPAFAFHGTKFLEVNVAKHCAHHVHSAPRTPRNQVYSTRKQLVRRGRTPPALSACDWDALGHGSQPRTDTWMQLCPSTCPRGGRGWAWEERAPSFSCPFVEFPFCL